MKKRALLFGGAVLLWAIVSSAQAFTLDYQYAGNLPLSGQSITATFTDLQPIGNFNQVKLDIDTKGLQPGLLVTTCYFNLSDLFLSSFIPESLIQGQPTAKVSKPPDPLYLGFDWSMSFDTGLKGDSFYSYLLTGVGLVSKDFDFTNGSANGDFFASADVKLNNSFGYIADSASQNPTPSPVPEPATMLLLGFGLMGLALIGRRLH